MIALMQGLFALVILYAICFVIINGLRWLVWHIYLFFANRRN